LNTNASPITLFIWQLRDAFCSPIRDRKILFMFVTRDLKSRYKNSWGGLIWLFIQPIILLVIYTVVFQKILGVKWGPQNSSGIEFALNLYLGLLVFNFFSESVQAAPSVLRNHSNLIKKVCFPIRILPNISVGTSLCDAVIGIAVWLVIYSFVIGIPHLTALYLPLVILPLILLTMGLCWIVASLSVYMRDINQVVRFVLMGLLFLSPIFFPLNLMPSDLQVVLSFNPLAVEIEMLRGIMIDGIVPAWGSYFIFLVFSSIVYCAGFYWFELTSDGFVDVL
jgi:lipopolysaccharide transport system permease protein